MPDTRARYRSNGECAAVSPVEIVGAALVLVVAVVAGTIVHELSHAVALRAFGVTYEFEWLPGRDGGSVVAASLTGGWARVHPRAVPSGLSPSRLRIAALMPLLLATPLVLALLGVVPDPLQAGDTYASAAFIGWLACALPSPQDFSLVWHADRELGRWARDHGPQDEHRRAR